MTLSATWNAATGAAVLSWTASTEADLARYQVRAVPGDEYLADDADATAPRTLTTGFALGT